MRAILTFHSIDSSGSVLSYPRKTFVAFLSALDSAGIPVMTIGELLKPDTRCGVALTFDDGMRSVVTDALSVLREFAAPAHLFLSTNSVGRTNRWQGQPADAPIFDMLDWKDIEVLRSHGVYIEGHSVNHPDLRTLSDDEIEAECCVANEHIRRRLGSPPRYFAFPYGHCDDGSHSMTE